MVKSTTAKATSKPAKPHPDFPLFPHATGRWAKKVLGKIEYFGPWADPAAALDKWLDQKDDLLAGRRPRARTGAATVAYLVNHFLTHKRELLTAGELAQRTFDRYYTTSSLIVATFGKNRSADDLGPDDFQSLRVIMARRWGAVALGNEVQIVRSIFKHAVDAGILATPIRFGPGFKKPSAKTLRIVRSANGPKVFSPAEIHAAIAKADANMATMLLLGINAAMGNTDLALLPIKAVDLATGWLDYPRHKTGIPRRIKLWPETVAAIRKCLAERREPKDPADVGLLFISHHRRLNYVGKHGGHRVAAATTRLLKEAKIEGRTFYDLRRTFQTVAEGARDLTAVQSIMGHAPPANDMSAVYRQRVDDERLQAVADWVRAWLFPPKKSKPHRKAK
jgi:integrase